MIDLGLTPSEFDSYRKALFSSHHVRTKVLILDQDELPAGEITSSKKTFVLDGEVVVDSSQQSDISNVGVTRSLTLSLLDPYKAAMFDPNAPSADSLFMNRFIKVVREDYVSELGRWIPCPIFHGPITKLDQDGIMIEVEAQGKESLYLKPHLQWRSRKWGKNTKVTDIMMDILKDKGESFFNIPKVDRKIHKPYSIIGTNEGWKIILKFAEELGMQAFYNGNGQYCLRDKQNDVKCTFSFDQDILTRPNEPLDFTTLRNLVQLKGPKPSGKKQERLILTARVPQTSPVSPESLGRDGKPRFMVEMISSTRSRMTKARGTKIVKKKLEEMSTLNIQSELEVLPAPFLEEEDVVEIETDHGKLSFPLKKFTIPVPVSGTMGLGVLKRSSLAKKAP